MTLSEREGEQSLQDHEYSVIGHRRSTIGRYLGMLATIVVSFLPAIGIGLSDALAKFGLPEWGKYFIVIPITASLTYTAIHWFFNKYGWRPLSFFAQIPNISGPWHCVGQTINDDGTVAHDWDADLTISQTWEKIRVKLETKSSISHSLSVALIPEPDGCWMLMYSYKNEPKVGNKNLNSHQGYSEMRFSKGLKAAQGEYFTAKGRGTVGTMSFTRRSR
ncbi:pancortin-3 [Pseudomonas chlororaphis]|uniref:Cap15 family cyclic dinucleotide receptor domain-containing protein n=1 Tax=Pseudomonas chlororaphis TaxID=587753 RepID=UPI001B3144BD|nr:pancortin-3 [Pseudomonas chlororaphis]QTT88509.1 pancortin-3 [Pseudomonas chlororaphis]